MPSRRRLVGQGLAVACLCYLAGGGGQATVALFTATQATTSTISTAASFDITPPLASDVQTANAGLLVGTPQTGDSITFTFSEPMAAGSILAGWSGSATSVVVRIANDAGGDMLTVRNAVNTSQLALGSVNLRGTAYVSADRDFGATGTPSTMTMSGSAIVVTLGTPSGSVGTQLLGANMTWTPDAGATDLAGNACSTTPVDEGDVVPDVEF